MNEHEEAELEKFYYTEIKPAAEKLNKQRKWLMGADIFLFLLLYPAFTAARITKFENPVFVILLILAAGITIFVSVEFYRRSRLYYYNFKNSIIARIFDFCFPGADYYPFKCIPRKLYKESGLFPPLFTSYYGSDLVRGSKNGINFIFSDICTENIVPSVFKGEPKRILIFRGFLLAATLPFKLSGQVFILPDKLEKTIGTGLSDAVNSISARRGRLIKLENPEFEKRFRVYADDPVLARKILSPAGMERIIELDDRFEKTIAFSFSGRRFYAALPLAEDSFEPPADHRTIYLGEVKTAVRLFSLGLNILDDFKIGGRKSETN